MGDHWMRLGGFASAQESYKRALAAYRGWGSTADLVAALNRLGLAYKEQGLSQLALDSFCEAVRSEPQSYESHNNLGFVLKDRGDYKQAKACFERALAIVRAAHGDAHDQTIVCLNNLGLLLKDSGQKTAALRRFTQALELAQQVHGKTGIGVVPSITSLAFMHKDSRRYAQAQACFEAALKITRDRRGAHHPDNVACLHNVAFLLMDRAIAARVDGDRRSRRWQKEQEALFHQAQQRAEEALALVREAYPDRHPRTAQALNSLAELLLRLGRPAAAQAHLEQALQIREALLGESHFDTAQNLLQLGRAWLARVQEDGAKAAAQAVPYLERAIATFIRLALAPHQIDELTMARELLQQARGPQPLGTYELMALSYQANSG